MTLSDDDRGFLEDFFDRHPEARGQFDRRMAMQQERQRAFDAMDLPELRQAAINSLTSAAELIGNAGQNATMPSDEWTAENRKTLAGYFLSMVESVDDENPGGINLSKWFDLFSIEETGDEGLQTAAYEAMAVYNAYLTRRSS